MKRTPLRPGRAVLERRTGLRRDGDGARRFAAQRFRLPSMSRKAKDRLPERRQVVAAVRARAGGRCEAAELVWWVACGGPLDVDERIPRSAWPDGQYVESNCQLLCRRHHDWKHLHRDQAVALGLRAMSWDRPA